MSFPIDTSGYYGPYGGAFIPEMLFPNVDELRSRYLDIIQDEGFRHSSNSCWKIM